VKTSKSTHTITRRAVKVFLASVYPLSVAHYHLTIYLRYQ
jgi:hypothetical protein